MGSVASRSEKTHLKGGPQCREYRLPHVRQKDRFNKVESSHFYNAFDAFIDKFDYLIVFPLTEGPCLSSNASSRWVSTKQHHEERITWAECCVIWRKAVSGTEHKRAQAVEELATIWKKRTGTYPKPHDRMRKSAWLSVAREALIYKLGTQLGLQLRVSANATTIYCRVRAPMRFLELQADRDNYRLQMRAEIDPGSEKFWNVVLDQTDESNGPEKVAVEVLEEKRLYSIDEARVILEKLYAAGKISPAELVVDQDIESPEMFSRRIHALERIADRVPVTNQFPAYTSLLSTKPHLRYLYQTYPSVRGTTIFRSKDRLLLTKSILDQALNLEVLCIAGVARSFFPLHDANRGEQLTIEILGKKWVTFWLPSSEEVGCPYPTHSSYDDDVEVSWFVRPFCQPLGAIREYFGEKVALYYAYLGYFTIQLICPCLLSVGVTVINILRGYKDTVQKLDYSSYAYVFLLLTWATLYEQSWNRECAMIAVKWGTTGVESEEQDRPEFVGDAVQPLKRSRVTNRRETYFPSSKRTLIQLGSNGTILLWIMLDLAVLGAVFYGQSYLYDTIDTYWFSWVVAALLAVVMQSASYLFRRIAKQLNDNENYRTDTEYGDNLVIKVIIFELINSLFPCAFTAFGKGYIFNSCHSSCVDDLRQLLYAIIFIRVCRRVANISATIAKGQYQQLVESQALSLGGSANKDEELQSLTDEVEDDIQFLQEVNREDYHGSFDEYADTFLQYSYIVLFGIVMPILAIISLIECLIKIRLDAYTLCYLRKRPHVELAEDAGLWAEHLGTITYFGIYLSVAIFTLSMDDIAEYSYLDRTIVFLLFSQGMVMYVLKLKTWLPVESDEVDEILSRQEYIINKFVKGYSDDDEDLGGDIPGHVEDTMDMEGLKLFDLRKGMTITDEDYTKIEYLEAQKRDLMRELRLIKDRLQDAYKTETFNDMTGVGETKHGLSLGRLSVRLVEIHNFHDPELSVLGPKPSFKIRVDIKGTKPGGAAPAPPFGALADSSLLTLKPDDSVSIQQSLGPFAPIRTIHAMVHFNVLNMSQSAYEANIATASVPLRDLQDQAQHDKILNLSIRCIDGSLKHSNAQLYVNLTFQYSKVVPIRSKVYLIQDKMHSIDRDLVQLRSGKSLKK